MIDSGLFVAIAEGGSTLVCTRYPPLLKREMIVELAHIKSNTEDNV
jgi:hypothetical protein